MNPVLEKLKDASAGLLYRSESDYPFAVVYLQDTTPSLEVQLLQLCGQPKGMPVEKITIEHFFRNMIRTYADSTAEQKETAIKFAKLQTILKEELQDVAVYGIGDVEVEAFIIGKLRDERSFGGLHTRLIET